MLTKNQETKKNLEYQSMPLDQIFFALENSPKATVPAKRELFSNLSTMLKIYYLVYGRNIE